MVDSERARARREKKLDRLREAKIDTAVSACLRSENGKEFIHWLLTIGKVGQIPYASDPHAMAISVGELNVGNQILARVLRADPDGYILMLKEKNNGGTSSDDNGNSPDDDESSSDGDGDAPGS